MKSLPTAEKRAKTSLRSFVRTESGQSLVEFALVAPVLLLMIIAILDLGRAVYISTVLNAAAQDGARAGTVSTNINVNSAIETAVQNRLSGVDPANVTITIDRTDERTLVELSHVFVPATPLISTLFEDGNVTLRGSAQMQLLGVFIDP